VCRKYANKDRLGASFFFSRDQDDRSKMERLFFTLAYRLYYSFPLLRQPISKALEDRSILSPNPRRQLRELILKPIQEITPSLSSPILIVIDALDECEGVRGEEAIVQFIDLLAIEWEACSTTPMLKILVASRPHPHLIRVSSRAQVRRNSKVLHLNKIEKSIHEADLRTLALHGLRDIAWEYRNLAEMEDGPELEADWPSESDVDTLLDLAGGLFISVATLLRLLRFERGEGGQNASPQRTLERLRGTRTRSLGLDGTYLEVLKTVAHIHRSPEARRQLHLLLAFIVLSFDRLSVTAINLLLSIKANAFLPPLLSVVNVPKDNGPIQALHASFHDFLINPDRCVGNDLKFIDAQLYHLQLARFCLKHLTWLKRDLLGLKDIYQESLPNVLNANIQDHIAKIPQHLSYSIRFWTEHAIHSVTNGCLEDQELLIFIDDFAQLRLLYWIEALGYLGYLKQGTTGLRRLLELLPVSHRLHLAHI
jgi:hypothetical protein